MVFSIFSAAVLVLAIFLALSAIKIVPQGYEYTVERFGRYTRTLKPGITILTPFMEAVGRKVSLMEQVLDVPRQEVITKDNVTVQVDAIVFIQVMDAAAAAYRVANLNFAIGQLTMTNLRTVVGSMELDEVLSQRDQINTRLLTVIDEATGPWGVKVARIEIKDLQPPPDITNAMARQMKAEREKRAVITEAEGEKQAAVTRAEGAKQSAILQAEGRREAAYRDAEARERSAQAEAAATKSVSDAIEAGSVNALNYFVAQKYVEAFAKLADSPQQRTVIVPTDMGSIAGSIAGITELVNAARHDGARGRASRPAARVRQPPDGVLGAMDTVDKHLALTPVLGVDGGRGDLPGHRAHHRLGLAALAGGVGGARGGRGRFYSCRRCGQVALFAICTIVTTYLGRRYLRRTGPVGPDVNDTATRLIGHRGEAAATFVNGGGRVFVDGKEWSAELEGPGPIPAGAKIEVVAVVGGARLKVRAEA